MTIKNLLILLAAAVAMFSSCEKQSSLTAPQPGQSPGKASFINRSNTFVTSEYFAILNEGQISMRIITDEGSEIMLNLNGVGVGTYELFKTSPNLAVFKELSPAGNFVEYYSNLLEQSYITGSVNILSVNQQTKTISGAFFFSGFAANGASTNVNNGFFTEIPFNDTLRVEQLSNILTAYNDTIPLDFRLITAFSYGDTVLEIKAQSSFNNPAKVLTVSMPLGTTAGNYPFTLNGPYIGTYRQSGSPITVSETGQLTVLFHSLPSMRVVGNFAFITKGPPSFNINTGNMIINYQKVAD